MMSSVIGMGADGALAAARERVRLGLLDAAAGVREEGMAAAEAEGQLIRPLVAYAAGRALGGDPMPATFWYGALAVQMVHEASLVHDDIVDQAELRRGRASVMAAAGVGAALVYGDHLLTSAYRMAARTDSPAFVALFVRSVERTVAGEIEQGRITGQVLDESRYQAVALGKAGELLGCALALGALVGGAEDAGEYFELGRRIGLLYQRVDDLLDYCPRASTGKRSGLDFLQHRWTWPLSALPVSASAAPFDRSLDEVLLLLRTPNSAGLSPFGECLRRIEADAADLTLDLARLLPGDDLIHTLILRWIDISRQAVERELGSDGCPGTRTARPRIEQALRARVPTTAHALQYLATNSRSFRFAARLLPPPERDRVARVYAFCRVTDDLVDGPGSDATHQALLSEWGRLSDMAYRGRTTGIELLDAVMTEMREAGVPFEYAADLLEGMRMDLRGGRYESMAELKVYTYRVASVVGLWLTRLAGVHDPGVLTDAARLGHAMQITNILRDVGEDWSRGRLYLPHELLREHGLTERDIAAMAEGSQPIGSAYRALVEHLLGSAETEYRLAFAAIPVLPAYFQRPVAIAAHVYRGIHAAIRRNGYDNFRSRAHTSTAVKTILAWRALRDLGRVRRGYAPATGLQAPTPPVAAIAGVAGLRGR